jgi:hypothetical protein
VKKTTDEKTGKKRQSRAKDADVRRRKIWAYISRKEIPRVRIFTTLYRIAVNIKLMGDSSYRLNFDQGKKNEIQHHS